MAKYSNNGWSMMSQRQRMSPFPNYMSMESVCKEMKKFVGANLKDVLIFFKGNMMFVFQDSQAHEDAGKKIADRVEKNPLMYRRLVKQEDILGNRLIKFAKLVGKQVNSKTSNRRLYEWFAQYDKFYKNVYAAYGSVWTMEDHLVAKLYDIVHKRWQDGNKISNTLNDLTKQPLAMVATIERQSLLKIAVKILSQSSLLKLIQTGSLEDIKKNKVLSKLITTHEKSFFWITRDYEDPILTYEDIVNKLKLALKEDPKKQQKELTDRLSGDLKERKRLEKELKLNKKELALFASMRDAANLKEQRKKFVSQSLYYFDSVLNEIGKRLFLSVKQVRFLRTSDAYDALVKNKDLTADLNERYELSVWHVGTTGTKIIVDKEAQKMFDEFCQVDKNATEFTGMAVSPGVARGPAKIVLNPNECDKVNKGDIIVSVQVVPSFSTAIIKSAGIVCDGGHGITSHPATLSREAGIPCVIQTRFVREVVKDGDILEVDGYKGIVKIIK